MLNKRGGFVTGFVLVGTLFSLTPVMAEDKAVVTAEDKVVVPATQTIAPLQSPLGGKALDEKVLAKQRGGTDPGVLNDMKLNGVVSDNRATNLTTGNNAITDGAFNGVSGVPLVVQNSGNNVLIQSATIINVQVK